MKYEAVDTQLFIHKIRAVCLQSDNKNTWLQVNKLVSISCI